MCLIDIIVYASLEVRVKFFKIFSYKIFGQPLGLLLIVMAFWYVVGALVSGRLEISWKPPRNYAHCPEKDIDSYYFQKLETCVDPRDSNEYIVLKLTEFRNYLKSENDSGVIADDTVTFQLMLENLRFKTWKSKCLDSTCERGRYYPFFERGRVCPAGWSVASAEQNAALHFEGLHIVFSSVFSPIRAVDKQDPSGLKRLRSRFHDGPLNFIDTIYLNLSGFYNVEKETFEFVDSLSIVWTSDGFASVIFPDDFSTEENALSHAAIEKGRMKPEDFYPVRCIRIDDPHHKMDGPKSNMIRHYNRTRELPYLYSRRMKSGDVFR